MIAALATDEGRAVNSVNSPKMRSRIRMLRTPGTPEIVELQVPRQATKRLVAFTA